MTGRRKLRVRYSIARLLDRLPGQCWTDLVCWAQYGNKRSPWSPVTPSCLADGCRCYCGKLRAEGDES